MKPIIPQRNFLYYRNHFYFQLFLGLPPSQKGTACVHTHAYLIFWTTEHTPLATRHSPLFQRQVQRFSACYAAFVHDICALILYHLFQNYLTASQQPYIPLPSHMRHYHIGRGRQISIHCNIDSRKLRRCAEVIYEDKEDTCSDIDQQSE